MYRVIWALLCEYHITDRTGKNSFLGVFEQTNIKLNVPPGEPRPDFPLEQPVSGPTMTASFLVYGDPGEPAFELRVFDPDENPIGNGLPLKMPFNPEGHFTANFTMQGGIPLVKPGIYAFRLFHGEDMIGATELRVGIDFVAADA